MSESPKETEHTINVFSYGTLQLPKVQLELLGREVTSWPDSLSRFNMGEITIMDETVIEISTQSTHQIINFTGNASDIIEGVVLSISPDELSILDKYETDEYKREELTLNSGKKAFVYVAANNSEMPDYHFEIIAKSWAKRRRFTQLPKPVHVQIPDFKLKENFYCNMIVQYDDGNEKEYFSRVLRNHITGQWTVDGMHVAVKVIFPEGSQ
ncbi:gamma-glutamylcyclotransferase family protein [Opacimonas viscosa]|uniref:Gamma-glutamylcyclotransferase n=1 Tax=Opacimonas viscosa TaxID=2961944 RepID=A0AA42BLH4_9ALTE|nr:gamma-glutamylcyclotransferase family protein [Opacimonas viscosa]MCP3428858.1 gamma-glutamylcyclotransferase [Opacimonas viscosa]